VSKIFALIYFYEIKKSFFIQSFPHIFAAQMKQKNLNNNGWWWQSKF